MTPFALLDDRRGDGASSRLYTGWCAERISHSGEDLDACWRDVHTELARGRHVVLLADYEWGVRLQGVALPAQHPPGCLRFLIFESLQRLEAAAVDRWLAEQNRFGQPAPVLAGPWQPEISARTFEDRVRRVHELIRAGETYQLNLTLRLRNRLRGDPLAFYRVLRARQPVPYGALIHRPAASADEAPAWVLSLSPELFVRHDVDAQGARLIARPMKGTAARVSGNAHQDQAAAAWLAADPKNRAENLMITDLLRNDLGRIARIGSVQVPALFAIEAHGALWQMTSTVQAEPLPQVDLPELLRALFPCGSITGAPKRHTMELIGPLEDSPRGLYTGSIGWVEPAAGDATHALGPLALSVAIRTLELRPTAEPDWHELQLGVGCGIVLDSDPAQEWQECLLKARFATEADPIESDFTLFETIRVEAEGQGLERLCRWPQHFGRLGRSAAALGFALPDELVWSDWAQAMQDLPAGRLRLRIDLDRRGRLSWRHAALLDLPAGPVVLGLAPRPLPAEQARLSGFKTSRREVYDQAIREAEAQGRFDLLFFNERDELTEGARSNVLVRMGGRWFTPPLSSGLLPGVMRATLLADPGFGLGERVIRRSDLPDIEAWRVCNALRGILPATLSA